jgi:hypothetical protein
LPPTTLLSAASGLYSTALPLLKTLLGCIPAALTTALPLLPATALPAAALPAALPEQLLRSDKSHSETE